MKTVFLHHLHTHFLPHIVLMLLSCAALLLAMGVDLYFGLRKARARGELRTSRGLKATAGKARKYYAPYLVLALIDLLGSVVMPLPALSTVWAAYCIFCEFVSVRESALRKAEIQAMDRTVRAVVANRDDLARAIVEALAAHTVPTRAPAPAAAAPSSDVAADPGVVGQGACPLVPPVPEGTALPVAAAECSTPSPAAP